MTIIEQAQKIRQDMNTITAGLTDEQALDLATLFMPWKSGTAYIVGNRVQHGGTLYKCVQAHTSQADWAPDATPALWMLVSIEEFPEKDKMRSLSALGISAECMILPYSLLLTRQHKTAMTGRSQRQGK